MILADLRTLLTRAHGAAVERLEDRTPEGVARAYLPRWICLRDAAGRYDLLPTEIMITAQPTDPESAWTLDLTDPGTVHAVKVALALAKGLDVQHGVVLCPGPMLGPWDGWVLRTPNGYRLFTDISEPDPIKALVLACQHVIREKA